MDSCSCMGNTFQSLNLDNFSIALLCYVFFTDEKNEDKTVLKEKKEFGDLDQLLRSERLKDQEAKENTKKLKPEVNEAEVIRIVCLSLSMTVLNSRDGPKKIMCLKNKL